ncbi:MAG: flagellar protein G [Candidatus Methanoperedens sp.]|nr:flagellar protein G [Candidatus Methanoperedens sp.]MCE8425502.1 flagellar protein G [Candidatus Methanoperedens sp.]MCE8428643.1 flagellar protein G [Candidatus Methanoperedens sp.]
MGAETSATHLIFFIVAMLLAASVAGIIYANVSAVTDAAIKGGNTLSNQLKTDITIINDPSKIPKNGISYTFYVKNTGKSNLAHELVTVIINGAVIPDSYVNKTIIGGSTVWRPADVLQLDVTYASMPSGDNNVRVITENGIDDSLNFFI